MTALLRKGLTANEQVAPPLAPAQQNLSGIDKSQLTIAEPKRLRDKAHLKFVASQPCLVCGRQPCDPHHLRFAQPRALGLKVSDEFTVPLCRGHYPQLHQAGNELAWWEQQQIKPLEIAKKLWDQTHAKEVNHSNCSTVPMAPIPCFFGLFCASGTLAKVKAHLVTIRSEYSMSKRDLSYPDDLGFASPNNRPAHVPAEKFSNADGQSCKSLPP